MSEDKRGTLRYSFEGQVAFAELSGDFNPLHVDRMLARRELFGDVVVHGVHACLDALELFFRRFGDRFPPRTAIARIDVRFLEPILLEQDVGVFVQFADSGEVRVKLRANGTPMVEIKLALVPYPQDAGDGAVASPEEARREPRKLDFEQLQALGDELPLTLARDRARAFFPVLTERLPESQIAALLAMTRIVGMECPGLQSVFSSFSLSSDLSKPVESCLSYRVVKTDPRFSLVKMEVASPAFSGQIEAFYRPGPQRQPEMDIVRGRVAPEAYAGQTALIVGGSRGIGEVTAKIVAAGGGHPLITYRSGKEDAARVVREIRDAGGRAESFQLDTAHPGKSLQAPLAGGTRIRPTHVYYFASPRIFGPKRSGYDAGRFQEFHSCYVEGFYRLYDAYRSYWRERVVFFYPSSVAIEERVRNLIEYAAAKAAGETLCRHLSFFDKDLQIHIERLPRIATDQTTTLTPYPAQNALDVMLVVMNRLCASEVR